MKHLLALFIGLLLLLPGHLVQAQNASLPYVEAVLARADTALAEITSTSVAPSFGERALPEWTRSVFSALAQLAITEPQTSSAGNDLLTQTACLHADVARIEWKMETVRDILRESLEERDFIRIMKLKELLQFLAFRIDVMQTGALDIAYEDTEWALSYSFDPMTEEEPPAMCPFDSDALPPSMSGFGCDIEAMDARLQVALPDSVRETLQAERNALAKVQAAAEQYAVQSQSLVQVQKGIDAIIAGKPVPPSSIKPVTRTHIRMIGCEVPACLEGDTSACRTMTGAVFTPLRGTFSLSTDHVRLMQDFQSLRLRQAARRPFSGDLREDKTDFVNSTFGVYFRGVMKNFSLSQVDEEVQLFALGADPHLVIGDALRPLREAVQRLARLTHPGIGEPLEGEEQDSLGSLRGFVRDFAYFLRRSCMERPCNERLDRTLKIIFAHECFPYTNGEFMSIDEVDECKKAAELETILP